MKILAFGDMQLGAHGRLEDQSRVLEQIATVAFDRRVDLVLNGGDTFEGPGITPECLEAFAQFVRALDTLSIPLLTISGNGRHDAAMRETNGLAIFAHVPGVTVASTPDVYRFDGCTVAALPWVSPARLQATYGSAASRDEVNQHVAELLVGVAQGLYEDCRRVGTDLPAVLLIHFAISGASLPTGLPVDLLREPVLPLAELEAIGFDAIVASHIHKPQLLATDPAEPQIPIFFTGSPMAHDFGEAGFEHGVWVLEFDGLRHTTVPEFVPIESRALVTVDADLVDRGLDDPHAALTEVLDAEEIARANRDLYRDAIVRFRYRATADQQRHIDTAALRHWLLAADAHSVHIEPQILRADRARVEGLDDSMSELDALDEWVRVNGVEEFLAGLMREKTRDYLAVVS